MEKNKFTLTIPIAIIIVGIIFSGTLYFSVNNLINHSTGQAGNNQGQAVAKQDTADITKVKTDNAKIVGKINAPLTIAYWYDYQCPFCKRQEAESMPQLIKDYVDTGKVRILFKNYQFLGADSQKLGIYSQAVWDVAPKKFLAWHVNLFKNQGQENSNWVTDARIISISSKVLNSAELAEVISKVKSNGNDYQTIIDAEKAEGSAMGINGTPGIVVGKNIINGAVPYGEIKSAIEKELGSK